MAIKIKKKDETPEEVEESPGRTGLADDADPFLRASVGTASWVEENRGVLIGGVVAIAVAVIGGYFGLQYLETQKIEASRTLTPVFESYNTLVKGSPELESLAANPDLEAPERTYESVQAKWQDVYDAAGKTLESYGQGEVAQAARLSRAAAALKLEKYDEAIKLYEAYLAAPHPDATEVAVRQGLATAYASTEKYDEAIKALDAVAERDARYAESAKYQKARILEKAGQAEQAKNLYHELLEQYPTHPQKSDIERRLAIL